MPTVQELTDPYLNVLARVPQSGEYGACETCRGLPGEGFDRCYACHTTRQQLGSRLVLDAYVAMSMCVDSGQFYHVLKKYKSQRAHDSQLRGRYILDLAALLWRFLVINDHERCLAAACGVERLDVITTVPSTSGRQGTHPLVRVVEKATPLKDRLRSLLVPHELPEDNRAPSPDRFRSEVDLSGQSVLVIEDLWVTGNHIQSAAAALKRAGAVRVAGFTFGRFFQAGWKPAQPFLQECAGAPFAWNECCIERAPSSSWGFGSF